ncbi:Hypothetical predicted protein [Cloeon dipterum]|uniref:Phlebovirus glycoprotein G2 fusion domain-containing protein n=1 Tax=Cloeon dipterum TaxID=197152 RepID=A0A8S1BVZ7_9INSE|nr:Hypothetical predicted protein [Cloeon dipterum]
MRNLSEVIFGTLLLILITPSFTQPISPVLKWMERCEFQSNVNMSNQTLICELDNTPQDLATIIAVMSFRGQCSEREVNKGAICTSSDETRLCIPKTEGEVGFMRSIFMHHTINTLSTLQLLWTPAYFFRYKDTVGY